MTGMSLAVLLTLVGCALGQLPHGIPVQHGFFIPVNTTNNRSVYPPANTRQLYPALPPPINVNTYQPPAFNPNLPPAAYDNRNLQNPYPVQQNNYPAQQSNFPVQQNNFPVQQNNFPVQQSNFPVQQNNYPNYATYNATSNNPNNKLVYGARGPNDKLLLKTIISKAAPILFGSTTIKELTFPDPNSKQRFNTITEIVLTNNKPNSSKFNTEIQKGGVGKSSVQLRLKTKSKDGLDLSLELWGKA